MSLQPHKRHKRSVNSRIWGGATHLRREYPHEHPRVIRRRRLLRRALLIGVLLLSLAGGALYTVHRPELRIQEVHIFGVSGEREVWVRDSIEVMRARERARLIPRDTFLLSRSQMEHALLAEFHFIEAGDVRVRGVVHPTLLVTVTERVPYAVWCANPAQAACYFIDAAGLVFSPADGFAEYVLFDGGMIASTTEPLGQRVFSDGVYIDALYTELVHRGYDVTRMSLSADEITLTLAQGYTVRVVSGDSVADIVSALTVALASEALRGKTQELEYVDIRFENRVYYAFKGGGPETVPHTAEEDFAETPAMESE